MPKITCKRHFSQLKIYINDLIHLQLDMKNHDGFQSWYEGVNKLKHVIEFYRKEGEPIYTEYDEIEVWKAILELLDKNI